MVECHNFTNMLIRRTDEKVVTVSMSTITSGEKAAYECRQREGKVVGVKRDIRSPAGQPGGRQKVKQA